MKHLYVIIGILLFIWGSIFLGAWLIFEFIVSLAIPIGGLEGRVISGVVKVALSSILVIFWLYIWKKLTESYFWKIVRKKRISISLE